MRPRRRPVLSLVLGLLALLAALPAAALAAPPVISGHPDGFLTNTPPSYTITGDGTEISWQLTGAAQAQGTGSPTPALGDGDGAYTLSAEQASDPAAIAKVTFTLDRTPPAPPTFSGPPAGAQVNAGPLYTLSAAEQVAFAWAVSDGPSGGGATIDLRSVPLAPGAHTVTARATDAAGNLSAPATTTFVIDVTPPDAPALTRVPPAISNDATPTFVWRAAEAGGTFEWQVIVGDTPVLTGATGGTTVTPTLPNDGTYGFRVRQVDAAGNGGPFSATTIFTLDRHGPAVDPSSTPAPGNPAAEPFAPLSPLTIVFNEPVQTLTSDNVSLCQATCGVGLPVSVSMSTDGTRALVDPFPASPTLGLEPLATYELRLRNVRDIAGNALTGRGTGSSGSTRWTFRTAADAAPPGPVSQLVATGASGGVELSWVPPSDADLAKVRVVRREGAAPAGLTDPLAVIFDVPASSRSYADLGLTNGTRYYYALYAIDGTGNPSPPTLVNAVAGSGATAAGVISPVAGLPSASPPKKIVGTFKKPRTYRARLLRPRAGAKLRTLRPTLHWRGKPKKATLSNLQIFLIPRRGKPHKVHSAFPKGTAYRVPAKVLKPGQRYLWRVWPYMTNHYAKRQLATSWFDVAKSARLTPRKAPGKKTGPAKRTSPGRKRT
jgi:Big-like domain-containing protein